MIHFLQVRSKLKQLVRKLLADIPNIKIGIIAHGDYCDYNTYVVKIQDLTSDVDTLVNFAQNTPSTGGGDMPEVCNIDHFEKHAVADLHSKILDARPLSVQFSSF